MAYSILKHRRGTTQEWLEIDLIPEDGELVIEECSDKSRKCKIGNGKNAFSELPYIDDDTKTLLLIRIKEAKDFFNEKIANVSNEYQEHLLVVQQNINQLEQELLNSSSSIRSEFAEADIKILEEAKQSFTIKINNT